jgi:hypothetical protein
MFALVPMFTVMLGVGSVAFWPHGRHAGHGRDRHGAATVFVAASSIAR